MLKLILVSAVTVLSFGFVTASPLSENNHLTRFIFSSQSESDESTIQYYAQNTEDTQDVSRGDGRHKNRT